MVGDQTFTLIGGIAVDQAFLARLARDRAIVVSLRYPGGEMSSSGEARRATRCRGWRAGRAADSESRGSVHRGRAGAPARDAVDGAAPGAAAQRRLVVSGDGRRHRHHRARAGGVGVVAHQQAARRSGGEDRRARSRSARRAVRRGQPTKSAGCRGCWASSPRGCAAARPACARPSVARPSATWPGRSITTSRTASSRFAT